VFKVLLLSSMRERKDVKSDVCERLKYDCHNIDMRLHRSAVLKSETKRLYNVMKFFSVVRKVGLNI